MLQAPATTPPTPAPRHIAARSAVSPPASSGALTPAIHNGPATRAGLLSLLPVTHQDPTATAANARREDGSTPLHHAAAHGNLQTLAALVQQGASLSTRTRGEAPLHAALNSGRLDNAQYLLAIGASPAAPSAKGIPPLIDALADRRTGLEKAALLLWAGADPNTRHPISHRSALMIAASEGDARKVDMLLAAGADASLSTPKGCTALALANSAGSRILIQNALDVASRAAPRH